MLPETIGQRENTTLSSANVAQLQMGESSVALEASCNRGKSRIAQAIVLQPQPTQVLGRRERKSKRLTPARAYAILFEAEALEAA